MQLIKDFLGKHQIKETSIAIGVSGGADSLALALLFKQELPQYHLVALTVDHGLRSSSGKEAEYVASVMEKYGIEHHILTWKGIKPKTAIEEEARMARYNLLCNWCKENGIHYLAVAHHRNDQAETFLMRLQRGSGLFGLASMREVSDKNGIKLLRPLLHTSSEALKDYLKAKKVTWVEDESNQSDEYLRVRIRKFLPTLEQNTGITSERLELAVKNLDKAKCLIEKIVESFINQYVCQYQEAAYALDYAVFLAQYKELQFYILYTLLNRLGQQEYPPEAEGINLLVKALSKDDFTSQTLNGCIVKRVELKIWIIKEQRNREEHYSNKDWELFLEHNPSLRGLKIPSKLRSELLNNNNSKKR